MSWKVRRVRKTFSLRGKTKVRIADINMKTRKIRDEDPKPVQIR